MYSIFYQAVAYKDGIMEIVKPESNMKKITEDIADALASIPKVDMEKYKTDFKKMRPVKAKVGR